MAGHDTKERKLFTDVGEKNRLAREFRRLSRNARRWQERAAQKGGSRWSAQYGRSIQRARERLAALQQELLARAQDLRARIEEEQKVSKSEIQKFEKQYKKEVEELTKAREALAEAEKAEADAPARETDRAAEVLAELRRKRWNAARAVRRETKDVKRAKKEVDSEAKDKGVLAYELRRVIAEIESLGRLQG